MLGKDPSLWLDTVTYTEPIAVYMSTWKLLECFASVFIWDHVTFDCG